ncbi:Flp pilus assembly protein CpaB [Crenobacter sp. SG2305]|uniref:Flp pilus assembly protein CpaB n=1 Tax=Crenobacter oryzisoli TaxID=3056844 RepID=UPI0025AB2BED|nr:Flp pilus assembly protein CpaB [Crenobacter sp. SG2305]MDN0085050.1 Flp pilus assembly protein CpaB [Crenobacter sp. SG2305]
MANITKVIAVILVLLALSIALYAWSLGRHPAPIVKPPSNISTLYSVVVATKLLPAGQPIASDAVRLEKLPINPEGSFKSVDDVVGQAPSIDLMAGSPVLATHMATGLAARVAVGERAVAIKVDETNAVGNRIEPGDYVDLFVYLKRDNGEVEQSQARLLLSKLRVLAYGATSVDGPGQAAKAVGVNVLSPRQDVARTAVLAVPVGQVNQLALAETEGRLLLALRNPQDNEVLDPTLFAASSSVLKVQDNGKATINGSTRAAAGLGLQSFSGASNERRHPAVMPPASSLALPSAHSKPAASEIEVIRGGKREMVSH